MGRPKASFYKAPRATEDVPQQVLPILVAISAVDSQVNEGSDAVWHVTVNRQGNVPTPFSFGIRTMTADELGVSAAELAGATDFSTDFIQFLTNAASATTGVTISGDFANASVNCDETFVPPFIIPRTTFNNPAEQGNKKSGLLIHSLVVQPTSGTITAASSAVDIVDVTVSAAIPTNTSVPTLSDTTPVLGIEVQGSDGVWAESPTSFLNTWQRRWFYDDAILDFDYTRDQFYFDGTEYASIAAMVSAGFYTVDATGDRVNLTGLLPSVFSILFKGTNAASIIAEENQTALVLDDGADAVWDDEVVLLDRYWFAGTSLILRTIVRNAGVSTGSMSSSANIAAAANNAVVKFASRIKANSCAMSNNGATVKTDNTVTMPILTRMIVGGTEDPLRGLWDGTIDRIIIRSLDMTNAELQAFDVPVDGDIVNATGANYTPVSADIGAGIRKGVIARNGAGDSAIVYSVWSSAVALVDTAVPVNTAVPTLSTMNPEIDTLVTCSTGTWTNSPTGYQYQWQVDGVNVTTDGDPSSYMPADIGVRLRCLVTAINASGQSLAVNTATTNPVVAAGGGPVAPVNTAVPTLSTSSPQVSVQVTCSTGTWNNNPVSFAYQWQKAGVNISAATSASYTPVIGDVGSALRCSVVATNAGGSSSAVFSASSSAVAAPPVPVNTAVPVISDTTPQQGVAITSSTGTWSNNPTSFSYQWIRGASTNVGTDSSIYTPVAGDVGSTLKCRVTAINAGGAGSPATSAATSNVAAAPSGSLTDVTLSTGLAYCPVDSAENTVICALQGVGGAIVTAVPVSGGTAGGIFKITGSSPSFNLAVGSVLPDFAGPVIPEYAATKGVPYYDTLWHFTGTQGGAGFDKPIRIWANWSAPPATGGGSATPTLTSVSGMATGFQGSTSNKVYQCDPTSIGVQSSGGFDSGSYDNVSFIGHRRAFFGKNGAWELHGDNHNILFQDMHFARGADLGAPLSDSDSFRVQGGGATAGAPRDTENVRFQNCNFTWSIDECMSIISGGPFHRNFVFDRCLFAEALTQSGLSDSTTSYVSHDYGPLSYNNGSRTVFHKCLIGKFGQRMPMFKLQHKGCLVQNCIISLWNTAASRGATLFTQQTLYNNGGSTGIVRANLYDPNRFTSADLTAAKKNPIRLSRVGSGNYIYVPEGGRFANHFYCQGWGGPFSLAADPITRSANVSLSDSDGSSLIDFVPFLDYYDSLCMPTETLAERTALHANVLDYVGVRARDGSGNLLPGDLNMSHEGHRIVNQFRTNGSWTTQKGAYPTAPANKGGVFTASNITIVYDTSLPT